MLDRRRAYYREYYHKHNNLEFLIKERERKQKFYENNREIVL
jgi:hypothetical protein